MVSIPDSFQPFGPNYVPLYEESARLKELRRREKWQEKLVIATGPFSALLIGALGRTREAIRRRELEERLAAREAARVAAYESRYGKFDLLTATMNAQRQSALPLMVALSRSQR